jgi:hypothetical protein
LGDPDLPVVKVNPERMNKINEMFNRKKTPFHFKAEMKEKYGLEIE